MTAFDTAVQTWVVHIAASSFVFTHTVHAIADFNFTIASPWVCAFASTVRLHGPCLVKLDEVRTGEFANAPLRK